MTEILIFYMFSDAICYVSGLCERITPQPVWISLEILKNGRPVTELWAFPLVHVKVLRLYVSHSVRARARVCVWVWVWVCVWRSG
jgi:hypothetical protein